MQKITPCLWFDDNAEEAVKFYTSIFKNSRIKDVARYGEAGAKASGRWSTSMERCSSVLEYSSCHDSPPKWSASVARESCP